MRYRITFNPIVYASQSDGEELRRVFGLESVDPAFDIDVFRQPYRTPKGVDEPERRIVWAIELPRGAFRCAFRDEAAPPMLVQLEDLIKAAREQLGATRQLIDKRRDYFHKDGALFCRRLTLEHVRPHLEKPAFINAVIAFLRAAEDDPLVVTGAPRPRRPHRTVEERLAHFGADVRGPAWTAEEDAVLRMWFGVRSVGEHAGRHAKLEDHEWNRVLELLGGMRTKNAVKNRLTVLNNQLRDRMLINGFVPRDRLREYMQQALGEAPRRPPMRPYPRMGRRGRRNDPRASRGVETTPA